jgi:site-specific DNA-methyltransferase (adenine-specific)
MIETNKIHNLEDLQGFKLMPDNTVDLIVTSPPYNNWRNRRTQARKKEYWERTNIVYDNFDDKMSDEDYEAWQIAVINECLRVLKPDRNPLL